MCDAVFGLCRSPPLFVSPNLTLTATTAAATSGSEWIIAVAVAVPVALLGVLAALLIVLRHRRGTAVYDRKANQALKESSLTALRTTT